MKILIAVEGNNFSKESLEPAIRFASRAKAEIHLLSIFTKDDTHITWKRNHVAEGASHHFLDASGSLPQDLASGPSHPGMVETRDQALEREVTSIEDRLSNVGRDVIGDQVATRVLIDSHFPPSRTPPAVPSPFVAGLCPIPR